MTWRHILIQRKAFMSQAQAPPLDGRTILVVEDEYLQAEDLVQALEGAGARLVGPWPVVSVAMAAVEAAPALDAAVLDINLRGQDVYALAGMLAGRGIPFLFATGYDRRILPQEYREVPVLEKPFKIERLVAALADLCASGRKDP